MKSQGVIAPGAALWLAVAGCAAASAAPPVTCERLSLDRG